MVLDLIKVYGVYWHISYKLHLLWVVKSESCNQRLCSSGQELLQLGLFELMEKALEIKGLSNGNLMA